MALLFVSVSLALDINLQLAHRETESNDFILILAHSYFSGANLILILQVV